MAFIVFVKISLDCYFWCWLEERLKGENVVQYI